MLACQYVLNCMESYVNQNGSTIMKYIGAYYADGEETF